MKKKFKQVVGSLILAPFLVVFLTGCSFHPIQDLVGEDSQIVLTAGFSKEEVFRIGDSSCYKPEFMVYMTNTQNRYESVYGSAIWSVSGNDMEARIKNSVAERIAQVKTMNLLADEYKVKPTDDEENKIQKAAKEYFESLNANEVEMLGVDEAYIAQMYREYFLMHKVYAYIIRDINPEISDDEARSVTVEWIMMKSPEEDAAIKLKLEDVLRRAQAGEDFGTLAVEKSDDQAISRSFGKGEVDPVLEECAFNLAEGEISQVVKAADGYYIIRCLSTLDRAETDANKEKIVTQRKKEAFNEVYTAFTQEVIRQINEKEWDELTMIHDQTVTTSRFFDVYETHFPNGDS